MSNYSVTITMSEKKFSRNKQAKIEKIYDAFFRLVSERGYGKTSTNHVAEEAGVSIGTVYRYFPDGKDDILLNYFENAKDVIFFI